jgi:hypothetical protein
MSRVRAAGSRGPSHRTSIPPVIVLAATFILTFLVADHRDADALCVD